MRAIYREVLADIDERIARLQGTRAAIASIADVDDRAVSERRQRRVRNTGRTKVGGGDQVVLQVIRDGANTLPTIVEAAKVKAFAARAALRRLRAAGKVRMNGSRRHATYVAKKG